MAKRKALFGVNNYHKRTPRKRPGRIRKKYGPGPGSLSFLYGDGNRQSITYQSVKPEDRDIFIFPAWIKHYVAPFYSDVTRISVSGNISNSVLLNQIKRVEKNK